MKIYRRKFLHLAACAAAMPAGSRVARAQAYPSRPITMVVPFVPGGALDVFGRFLAKGMRAPLGENIIVENIPGANGIVGVGRVARAAPDGYTVLIGYWGTHVANGALYKLPYDVLGDFDPIALGVTIPVALVSKKTAPAGDLRQLIEWLKTNPNKASVGTSGIGSVGHISGILFQNVTGTRLNFVPYRGAAPALQDLVAGQIDLMISNVSTVLPQVREGNIKALAVASKTRFAAAPEIPSADEAGAPGFYVSTWLGVWAPKGTPRPVIEKLNSTIVAVLADAALGKQLADQGFEIFPRDQQTPEALGAYQKAEIEKWWPIINTAGIKAE
jgi:tripartite-type tricarboxylate transporter receptor subunit TctC